ncbi:MAG: rod shape-determining protein MreD [Bacilli bacterium]
MIRIKHIVLPILLAFAFFLEGTFASLGAEWLYGLEETLVPRFLFVILILSAIFLESRLTYVYACVFGFFYDLMYTEVIGVYAFAFPVIVSIVVLLMKMFQSNLFVVALVTILGIIILEYYAYFMFSLIGYTEIEHDVFLRYRMLPTLAMNVIVYLLAFFPMRRLFLFLQRRSEQT